MTSVLGYLRLFDSKNWISAFLQSLFYQCPPSKWPKLEREIQVGHWIERERDWKKVEIESGVGSDGWGRGLRKRSWHVALWIRRGPWPEWGGRGGQRTSNGGCPLAVPVLGCTNRARLYLCCGRCSALAVNLLSFSFPNSNGGGRWAGAGFFVFFICPFRCLLMAVPESVQW